MYNRVATDCNYYRIYLFFFLSKEKDTKLGTSENVSSASGLRFTVDESSIYWTQQAHEDQRPLFKNDHREPKKESSSAEGGTTAVVETLRPPPMQSSASSSIYRTDDQQDRRQQDDDGGGGDGRRFVGSVSVVDVNGECDSSVPADQTTARQDDRNDDDGVPSPSHVPTENTTNDDRVTNVDNGDNEDDDDDDNDEDDDNYDSHSRQQHGWTAADDETDDNGYQMLTCRVNNNFYTNFRW